MALKFRNIRTGEELTANDEPQIAALLASSDRSPNITQGQDFGWRLAPSVVVELKRIKQDMGTMQQIAAIYNRPLEDISESDILTYISDKTAEVDAPIADDTDYQDAYDQEVRRLMREENKPKRVRRPRTTTKSTTKKPSEDK